MVTLLGWAYVVLTALAFQSYLSAPVRSRAQIEAIKSAGIELDQHIKALRMNTLIAGAASLLSAIAAFAPAPALRDEKILYVIAVYFPAFYGLRTLADKLGGARGFVQVLESVHKSTALLKAK
jgi:hypothetical protein